MSDPAFTLTIEQLEALIRKAVREELRTDVAKASPATQPTEQDVAKARKSLRRYGRGA